MTIRAYQKEDLLSLYEIYSYYVKTTPYNFDLRPMSFDSYKEQIDTIAQKYPIFVACHDQHVIGYTYVHPAFSKEAYRYCMEVTIYFEKGPHYGLADPLLETLEKACKEKGYRWLISCITASNQKSIEFHKRHGYVFSGLLPECGYKEDQWHGVVWMVKDLTAKTRSIFIASSATVIGDVTIEENSSFWYGSVVRGDSAPITIGKQTNLQDNAIVHASSGHPCVIGDRVTIGHNAIVHGCHVEDEVLIGMGAIVMDGAHIGKHSIIAAGALVPEGKDIPQGSVVMGCPGKIVHKTTPEQVQQILDNAQEYVEYGEVYSRKDHGQWKIF